MPEQLLALIELVDELNPSIITLDLSPHRTLFAS